MKWWNDLTGEWWRVFQIVTAGALVGMVLGAMFGFIAGIIATDFFERQSGDWNPLGYAAFLGGRTGVKLGGGLAVFGILVQMFNQRKKAVGNSPAEPKP